jgi:hypothetical protein
MNLVFPALAVFVFVLPGLIFRSAYNKGRWTYPLGRMGAVAEQVPRSLVHAIWLNAVWALVVEQAHRWFPNYIWLPDYKSTIYWMTNNFGKGDEPFVTAVQSLASSPIRVLAYFSGLCLYAYLIGFLLHGLVRSLKWDRTFRLLRFDNEWHYLLRGEILDFSDKEFEARAGTSRAGLTSRDRAFTMVAAVVEMKDASFLYKGVLIAFYYDEAGRLDRMLIEETQRRKLTADNKAENAGEAPAERYYSIRGHYLVLRLTEIKTLNIDYVLNSDIEEAQRRIQEYMASLIEQHIATDTPMPGDDISEDDTR